MTQGFSTRTWITSRLRRTSRICPSVVITLRVMKLHHAERDDYTIFCRSPYGSQLLNTNLDYFAVASYFADLFLKLFAHGLKLRQLLRFAGNDLAQSVEIQCQTIRLRHRSFSHQFLNA